MLSNNHIMTDLHQIIDLRSGSNPRPSKTGAIDRSVGSDFHIVVHLHDADLRNLHLPAGMKRFSSWRIDGELKFVDLINPDISFDFLGGMFLSVFRRKNWAEHVGALDAAAISDSRTFSHFDNTFPHVKIFSRAFSGSRAYFNSRPLIVCLTGAREWAPMYPLVHSVRLVEALDEYKKNGLGEIAFRRCKNFALNNFIPDLASMYLRRKHSGYAYVHPLGLILENCRYPNFYFSFFNFFIRKGRLLFSRASRHLRRRTKVSAVAESDIGT